MYIFYCGTKGQTDVKQNYSSDVRDDAQYKTYIYFVPQNYLANVRVTRGTNSYMVKNSLTGLKFKLSATEVETCSSFIIIL